VAEWDAWRAAGVKVVPVYREENDDALVPLLAALFEGPGGLQGVLGANPSNCAVLMSGPKGISSAALSKKMILAGVEADRMLFCDFFGRPNA